jgi:ABC-type transporter Mla MlaB component
MNGTRIAWAFSAFHRERDMLKITELYRNDSAVTFKLEGKVLAPWLEELRRVCAQSLQRSTQVRLDLDAVTFADAAGVALLHELIGEGVILSQCSGFVAELLHLDGKSRSLAGPGS